MNKRRLVGFGFKNLLLIRKHFKETREKKCLRLDDASASYRVMNNRTSSEHNRVFIWVKRKIQFYHENKENNKNSKLQSGRKEFRLVGADTAT